MTKSRQLPSSDMAETPVGRSQQQVGSPSCPLGELSTRALSEASRIQSRSSLELAAWLYAFNTEPGTRDAELAGVVSGLHQRLRELGDVRLLGARASTPEWLSVSLRKRSQRPTRAFKLYLSPKTHHVEDALFETLGVVGEFRAHQIKVAGNDGALLRPDKCVLYFDDQEDLYLAASRLCERLDDLEAQGVPFTASASPSGVLSWAVDLASCRGSRQASWRQWVCKTIADAMWIVGSESTAVDRSRQRCDAAIERLETLGVDTGRWLLRGATRVRL